MPTPDATKKDAIRSAPSEPRRDAATYGDEAGVATREGQDADPGSGPKVGGASTDAIRSAEARYDYEAHEWVPQCPHRDICTGCDAVGRCTRMEPQSQDAAISDVVR